MKEPVVPAGVLDCWRGPAYHWHWEWVGILLLGFVGPLLLAPRLPDGAGGFVLFFIILSVWLFGSFHLAARHADPDSIWLSRDGD